MQCAQERQETVAEFEHLRPKLRRLVRDLRMYQDELEQSQSALAKWDDLDLTKEQVLAIDETRYLWRAFPLDSFPRPATASQNELPQTIATALKDGIVDASQAILLAREIELKHLDERRRWIAHYEGRVAYCRTLIENRRSYRPQPERGGACMCWASVAGGWSYIQSVSRNYVTVHIRHSSRTPLRPRRIPLDTIYWVMSPAQVQEARASGRLQESAHGEGFTLCPSPAPPSPAATTGKLRRAT
jgi:hypothetical protein